ncbi:membrane protein [Paraoerskovia sediminicola]|uniref:Membrane protein n=1 Tax=Paraoerskovia sediminicola TaxID=1138587 RepID=A0ABM8G2M8_9CELL|nr:DUF1304 domain-containing protein [Paraoerskovia sediminicola]BDZ42317.1 membrane protein [Paraoerskovia sediminicola]
MPATLNLAASAAVALAGLVHVAIFLMESVFWGRPQVHGRFGVRDGSDAETVRPWAFNQGFYNLLLAVVAFVGVAVGQVDAHTEPSTGAAGVGMALGAVSVMLGAAIVLVLSDRRMGRPAAVQGFFPLLAVVLIFV